MRKKYLLISLILFIGFYFVYNNFSKRLNNLQEKQGKGTITSPLPAEIKNEKTSYTYDETLPTLSQVLYDNPGVDSRSLRVYLYDDRIKFVDGEKNDSLVISSSTNPDKYDYSFYSDVGLLISLRNKTATIPNSQLKSVTIKYEADKDRYFDYIETRANMRVLRKYLFVYGKIEYLISVDMDEKKEDELTILTNKMLTTLVPHTISTEVMKDIVK
ncbi:hypothetical protein A3B57_02230 [Microgenomates group bacterium RIFCSPLOWO2_01_FULL_47_10]|nr:MAG: hypothetical protein A3B57_02230 [Microgenomates group bacterium RIFCSPLOWO2_01_FULL_47_10]